MPEGASGEPGKLEEPRRRSRRRGRRRGRGRSVVAFLAAGGRSERGDFGQPFPEGVVGELGRPQRLSGLEIDEPDRGLSVEAWIWNGGERERKKREEKERREKKERERTGEERTKKRKRKKEREKEKNSPVDSQRTSLQPPPPSKACGPSQIRSNSRPCVKAEPSWRSSLTGLAKKTEGC